MVDDRLNETAEDLVGRSSLGTPESRRLRSLTDAMLLDEVFDNGDSSPACGHTWDSGLSESCDVCIRFVLKVVLGFARQLSGSETDAADVAHEVFELLISKPQFGSLRGPSDMWALTKFLAQLRDVRRADSRPVPPLRPPRVLYRGGEASAGGPDVSAWGAG